MANDSLQYEQFCQFPLTSYQKFPIGTIRCMESLLMEMESFKSFLCIQTWDISHWSNTKNCSITAIVIPTNEQMLGSGGAYKAIHNDVGPQLKKACLAIPEVQPGFRCPTGEASLTPGFNLSAPYAIHTVGTIYGSDADPKEALRKTYRSCLSLAKENNIECVAFPALSCGSSGFPDGEAAAIALETCQEFKNDFKLIYFVFNSNDVYNVWMKKCMCTF